MDLYREECVGGKQNKTDKAEKQSERTFAH